PRKRPVRAAADRGRMPSPLPRGRLRPVRLRLLGVWGSLVPSAEGLCQQVGHDARIAGRTVLAVHRRDLLVVHLGACAAQAGRDDANHVGRRQLAGREARNQSTEIFDGKGRLQFGQRAQRQSQLHLAPVEDCRDLASSCVRGHQAAVKEMAPADSRASSNVTSPSWLPAYSSALIWNGPSTTPKSGMASCQSTIAPSKKVVRISTSDAASLKMPAPVTAARCTPLPASSSRHRPAESASVTSTVSLLNASFFVRKPATVTKLPVPSPSSLRRMSLPF